MNRHKNNIWIFVFLLGVSSNGFAQHVELVPVKDNTIYQNEAKSYGGGEGFFAGSNAAGKVRRGLIQFDVSLIPSTAVIDSASLTLTCDLTNSSSSLLRFHRLTSDWGEGTQAVSGGSGGGGAGGVAQVGDATWSDAMYTTQAWNTAGGDFVVDTSVSLALGGTGEYEFSSAGLVQDIEDWVLGVEENYGWIILGNENASLTAYRFVSREGSAAKQPKLTVYYHVTTAVDQEHEMSGIVFQNPVSDEINLPEGVFLSNVSIYSAYGKRIGEYSSVVSNIDVNDLQPGIYQLTYVKDGKILAQKFIKQ